MEAIIYKIDMYETLHLRNMHLNNRDFEVGEDTVKVLAEIKIINKLDLVDLNNIKDLFFISLFQSMVI